MIYTCPAAEEPIDQGDIIDSCPLVAVDAADPDASEPLPVFHSLERVIVLTQTCDLAQRRSTRAVIAVMHES